MSNALAKIVRPEVIDAKHEPLRPFTLRIEFPDLAGDDFGARFRSAEIDHQARINCHAALSTDELSLLNDIARLVQKFTRSGGRR